MFGKLLNIADYILFPLFLFVLVLQFGTFLVSQILLFVGGFSTDALPLPTILTYLPFIVGCTFMPLIAIHDFGKPDLSNISVFRVKLEIVMLRAMAVLTALAFVLCGLFWFSYLELPRFESVTFIQAGVFTLLVAFDNQLSKKYLKKSEPEVPYKQHPITISQTPNQDIFYV